MLKSSNFVKYIQTVASLTILHFHAVVNAVVVQTMTAKFWGALCDPQTVPATRRHSWRPMSEYYEFVRGLLAENISVLSC